MRWPWIEKDCREGDCQVRGSVTSHTELRKISFSHQISGMGVGCLRETWRSLGARLPLWEAMGKEEGRRWPGLSQD